MKRRYWRWVFKGDPPVDPYGLEGEIARLEAKIAHFEAENAALQARNEELSDFYAFLDTKFAETNSNILRLKDAQTAAIRKSGR